MRIGDELKRRLEGIRGDLLRDKEISADIPCRETSDAARLCADPVVSVCMITYNHEKYLQQAIDGVMAQVTDFAYELILAEDCSTDGTRAICLANQARHPDRIRVLWSDANVGMSRNADRAQKACRGEFVAVCEGDDYWVNPSKLQKQVDLMRRHPSAGICFGGNDIFYEFNGFFSPYDPKRAPEEFVASRDFCWRLLFARGDRGFYIQNLHTSTHLLRRAAMEKAKEDFEDAYRWTLRQGDVTLLFTVAAVSDVCFLGACCSVYRMNDGGVTRSVGARSLMDGDFLKVYFCMKVFGWPFETAFAAFSDLLVNRWVKIALESSPDVQRDLARAIERSPDLRRAFGRWHCRGFFRALARGALTKRHYKLLRPLFSLGAHLSKWKVRRRLKRQGP